ncbi:MAG TPA: Fic family protein [Planctomycetota bacterium]|nr:Fic family protein [Planctomycetota bacterium]
MPVATSWLIGACMEAKGKQDLWTQQKPEALAALREQALIQSVESSNRIEGVIVDPGRLRPILLGGAVPRDRPEEELLGYRTALNWIFSRKGPQNITPDLILSLHEMLQSHAADAGKWKARDNEIIEFLPSGERKVRFIPTAARQVPAQVKRLCAEYSRHAEEDAPALLLTASFVFDFLCIHPFRDGNGRVSRLLTTLLLQNNGFNVSRYVSLERLIEETKADYYRVLRECSIGWHDGANSEVPWWNYLLGIVRQGYAEFARKIEQAAGPGKSELIRFAVERQHGQFSLADIAAQCPSVSSQLIKKVLLELKAQKRVKLTGRGRGAKWERLS